MRSANRGSNNLYRFLNQNITDQPSMKRRVFLVCLFYCFFRLSIYESIAAIFWQSASYILFGRRQVCEAIAALFRIQPCSFFSCQFSSLDDFFNSRPHLLSRLLLRSYFFFTFSNFFSLYHFAAFSTFCVKSF